MRTITFSRFFPKGHIQAGDATFFMEKILCGLGVTMKTLPVHLTGIINYFQMLCKPEDIKLTTIRAGNRWKAGDMASLRVWSGRHYNSKQIEFAQVDVKKVWSFEIKPLDLRYVGYFLNGSFMGMFDKFDISLQGISRNDGLTIEDFISWFSIYPKKTGGGWFQGQVITWHDNVKY